MIKLQPRQHRHQGLRNEAGARSSPRGGSRLADSCGHPSAVESTGPSTRNRESAPGSPNPRGAHSHPDRVIGCRLLQMQELPRNATTPFSCPPPPPQFRPRGPATAPGHGSTSNGRWIMSCTSPCPPYHSTTQPLPSLNSGPILSFLPPVLPPASLYYTARDLGVLRNTMVRLPPPG